MTENEIVLETGTVRKSKGILDIIIGIFSDRYTRFPALFEARTTPSKSMDFKEIKELLKDLVTKEGKEYEIILRVKE